MKNNPSREIARLRLEISNLKRKVKYWESAIFSIKDLVFITDKKSRIVEVNSTTAKFLGSPAKKLLGKDYSSYFGKANKRALSQTYKKTLRTKERQEIELFLSKKGKYLHLIFDPMFDNRKRFITILHVILDITDKKLAEYALQKSEERFRQVAENTDVWIWETDTDGLYTFSSPISEKILGYKPQELVGKKHFYDLFHPHEKEHMKQEALTVFSRKKIFTGFVNRNAHKNGDMVWLSTSGVPMLDEKGDLIGYRGSDTDVTEQMKVEQIKNNLIRDVSHRLKSPVAMIEMALNLCDKHSKAVDIKRINSARKIAKDNIKILHKDIDNILEISELDVKSANDEILGSASLKSAIKEIVDTSKHQLKEKGIQVDMDIPRDANRIPIGKRHLMFLMGNLIDNSIKFTESGTIKVRSRLIDGAVEIQVADTGCGIVISDTEKLFARFYKHHIAADGSGLGLSICKEIVEMYSGQIELNSKGHGKGATVTIRIPKKRIKKKR